jgi:hypothetical protein
MFSYERDLNGLFKINMHIIDAAPLEIPRRRREDNIKMDLKET